MISGLILTSSHLTALAMKPGFVLKPMLRRKLGAIVLKFGPYFGKVEIQLAFFFLLIMAGVESELFKLRPIYLH